jgi:hypothetical protein
MTDTGWDETIYGFHPSQTLNPNFSLEIAGTHRDFVQIEDIHQIDPELGGSVVSHVESVIHNKICVVRMKPGYHKASIIDFVMALTGQNYNKTTRTIKDTQKLVQPRVKLFWLSLEPYMFPGIEERPQYVLSASECIELMMMLPGSKKKEFKISGVALIRRIFSNDPRIHTVLLQHGLTNAKISDSSRPFVSRMMCLPAWLPSPWHSVIPNAVEIYTV